MLYYKPVFAVVELPVKIVEKKKPDMLSNY
jgi:hypothetical protein